VRWPHIEGFALTIQCEPSRKSASVAIPTAASTDIAATATPATTANRIRLVFTLRCLPMRRDADTGFSQTAHNA
jgi:2-methylisocitrate lyase-like PEP mutase family enzyme